MQLEILSPSSKAMVVSPWQGEIDFGPCGWCLGLVYSTLMNLLKVLCTAFYSLVMLSTLNESLQQRLQMVERAMKIIKMLSA